MTLDCDDRVIAVLAHGQDRARRAPRSVQWLVLPYARRTTERQLFVAREIYKDVQAITAAQPLDVTA